MPSPLSPDVLVVGGGPAGAAAAFWLSRHGHEVLLAEKSRFPREKTCGDGLTPRSVYELAEMGFDFDAPGFQRCRGLRAVAGGLTLELEWPAHPVYPNWGGVIRRTDLDRRVLSLAEGQGTVVQTGTEATAVLGEGRIDGVLLREGEGAELARPRVVVVADGALRRFGRVLGARRNRRLPIGLGARAYFASPRSGDGYLESYLDLHDASGAILPGYGWVFPLGDGTVNAGVGVISTYHRWREVNTSRLMSALAATAPPSWGLAAGPLGEMRGGMLPMARSVGPVVGPNWVLAGDAAGMVNPFNGEGIAYAYETGRLAAGHVHRALAAGDLGLLQGYRHELDDRFGPYHRVGRVFSRLIGSPGVMRALTRLGMRSRPLMEWALRVMADLVDPADRGAGAAAYRLIERIVRVAPGP
jgi:geranylgeranyl reductase family protein